MKVTISYKYQRGSQFPYIASTTLDKEYICTCGTSWEDARARMSEKLSFYIGTVPDAPPPEEVEIGEAAHVNQS